MTGVKKYISNLNKNTFMEIWFSENAKNLDLI